jgi:glycosyltransferase involved in cell wall biosynthesis
MLGIVIPAYKRKDCLREALESLTVQTMKRFFVIVVDDHSPEPLEDVVNEFTDKLHIKYIYAEENGGPGAARQIGLEACYKAGFDLIMFMDSDDMLYPQAIARLTHEINHNSTDMISSGIWVEKRYEPGWPLPAENKTWLHGKIFRTQYLKDNNIYFPPIRTNEDVAFNLMVTEGTEKKAIIEEVLYLFRDEKSSITRCGENIASVNGADYIDAIYYAAKHLKERECLTDQMFVDILNCYNFYQQAYLFGGEVVESTKRNLSWLVNLDEFQKKISDPKWLKDYLKEIKQAIYYNNQIHYFRQTFIDWLEEMQNYGNSNN